MREQVLGLRSEHERQEKEVPVVRYAMETSDKSGEEKEKTDGTKVAGQD